MRSACSAGGVASDRGRRRWRGCRAWPPTARPGHAPSMCGARCRVLRRRVRARRPAAGRVDGDHHRPAARPGPRPGQGGRGGGLADPARPGADDDVVVVEVAARRGSVGCVTGRPPGRGDGPLVEGVRCPATSARGEVRSISSAQVGAGSAGRWSWGRGSSRRAARAARPAAGPGSPERSASGLEGVASWSEELHAAVAAARRPMPTGLGGVVTPLTITGPSAIPSSSSSGRRSRPAR
jgi:hypothetical protein